MEIELGGLRRFIVAHYSLDELRTLCVDLNVNCDVLDGQGLSAKARELILWLERRGRLGTLLAALQRDRPEKFAQAGFGAVADIGLPAAEGRRADAASVSGSGALAQDDSVASGAGGVAVGRDVHGPVIIAGAGAQVTITTLDESTQDREAGGETNDDVAPEGDPGPAARDEG